MIVTNNYDVVGRFKNALKRRKFDFPKKQIKKHCKETMIHFCEKKLCLPWKYQIIDLYDIPLSLDFVNVTNL